MPGLAVIGRDSRENHVKLTANHGLFTGFGPITGFSRVLVDHTKSRENHVKIAANHGFFTGLARDWPRLAVTCTFYLSKLQKAQ